MMAPRPPPPVRVEAPYLGGHNVPIDKKNYEWLDKLGTLPRMVVEARALLGTVELNGAANSPTIMAWAEEVKGDVAEAYKADSVPWCGLFISVIAKRSGKTPVAQPLWALNWRKFGVAAGQPALGDVLVFVRPGGGHVALYIGEDSECYHVIGGNQTHCVCVARIDKERLLEARRPPYMNQPASVQPRIVSKIGGKSDNEA